MAKLLGKILKGVGIAAGVVGAGAAIIGTGGAAAGVIPAVVKGGGLLSKLFKGASKISKSAVNLVAGTTAAERAQVKVVKQEGKAAQDKLDQVERLINAGATRTQAMQMAGVTAAELGSADAAEKDLEMKQTLARTDLKTIATTAGPGCLVIVFYLLEGIAAAAAGLTAILTIT